MINKSSIKIKIENGNAYLCMFFWNEFSEQEEIQHKLELWEVKLIRDNLNEVIDYMENEND